ncbi:zinc finger domain-containing protein [Streptomyces sp. enrichment culture]|uniref:zinc finger domain-containing protein n=1 Tax=Streptomyces sp. enrichment culture TaxID=1795815 RepID=UPI003F56596A
MTAHTPDTAPALSLPAIAVACPMCGAQPGTLCTSHDGTRVRRNDVHRDRSRAHGAVQAAQADTTAEQRLAVLDGRDALAAVIIRPAADDDPDRITVEAHARGMSKAAAAYVLRSTADHFDQAARAEGDEPIPDRADHAVSLYARTAIERDDALAEVAKLRAQLAAQQPTEDTPLTTDDVRAALAFNADEPAPALATLRDVLLDTAPRTPEQALDAARVLLAAHARELVAHVRRDTDAYRDEHGVTRSTRGLLTGMAHARRTLEEYAAHLDQDQDVPATPTRAQVRTEAFEDAAAIAEQAAAEMRDGAGTWPEEWSSREIRDAIEAAAARIRAAATPTPA